LVKPQVNLQLTKHKKSSTNPLVFQQEFHEFRSQHSMHKAIYTDGSKDGPIVSAATVTPSGTISSRLPDGSSIFTAEAKAIFRSLQYISTSKSRHFIIFCDSLSCLQAIKNCRSDHPILRDILELHDKLSLAQNDIIFYWLPSHMGIRGNSLADSAAKSALNFQNISTTKVPYTDSKPAIKTYIQQRWQTHWDQQQYNKLHAIKPQLGYQALTQFSRHDAVVLRRCRIGHSHLTHSFLLKGEQPPTCIPCQCPLTVEHILLRCIDTDLIRSTFYQAQTLSELFTSIPAHLIIAFLKAIHLYGKM
jgi:ribonuclease HI